MAFKRSIVIDDEGDEEADHLRQAKARRFRLEDHGDAHPAWLNDVQVSHLDVDSEEDYPLGTGQNLLQSTSTGSSASQAVDTQREDRTLGGIKLTADVAGRLASAVLARRIKKGTSSVDQDLQHLLILSLLHADCPAAMLTQKDKGDDTEDVTRLLTWDDVYLMVLSRRLGLMYGNHKEAVQATRTQSDARLRWRRPEAPLIAAKSRDWQFLIVGSPSTEEVDTVVMYLGMAAGALPSLDIVGEMRFATEPFEAVFRRPSLHENKLIEQRQRWRDEAEEEPERSCDTDAGGTVAP